MEFQKLPRVEIQLDLNIVEEEGLSKSASPSPTLSHTPTSLEPAVLDLTSTTTNEASLKEADDPPIDRLASPKHAEGPRKRQEN